MKTKNPRIYPLKIPISKYPEIGDRLRCAMEIRNVSTADLSNRLFITRSAISGYRTGFRLPSCEILKQLALELDVTSDFLLGLDEYIYISPDEKHSLSWLTKK